MAFFDLPLEQLHTYVPDVREPDDFDTFWNDTLTQARGHDLNVQLTRVDTGLTLVESYDVEFSGFNGDRIKAWLNIPAGHTTPMPAVIQFQGYGGGRGFAQEHLIWANAGYAHLLMDTRGQGSHWGSGGTTPDTHGSDPAASGVMTRGILDPEQYYYRRLYTDAVRAVEAARTLNVIDPTRITVTGASQGGGIALAVAGLVPDVTATMPDVPFLNNFARALAITDSDPYHEITRYLSVHRTHGTQALHTLSYFDGVNFARRAASPALFSVALMDDVCPPSTVFSAYNVYNHANKNIEVYPYNQHEGGQFHQVVKQLSWLRSHL
ncbi:acetylxylan esterase [Timonella sp. A28]|uniref:acetylxylan esterase n=1 Tax=Timonella sp. A28 TaxID=3442640 RepID=UPI003EB89B18